MASLKRLLLLALPCALTAGCRDISTQTELNPAGPPMVRQVRLFENFYSSSGTVIPRETFAFGDHPEATEAEKGHVVTTGSSNGAVRVVVDELLVGNYLERISCADGSYSDVPVGATPDDIAACAESADVLPRTCVGEFAVCLGPNGPIGIDDLEPGPVGDGAADKHQFIDDSVQIICDGKKVPLSLNLSFWQPAGNQQKPAQGGLAVLGPAVVLVPLLGFPTGSTCTVKFAEQVVDIDGNQVCAPTGGEITSQCTPGDTSLISWKVDTLQMLVSRSTLVDGATSVSRTAEVLLAFNAELKASSLSGVTLRRGATNVPVVAEVDSKSIILIRNLALDANTLYTLTIPTTVTDILDVALKAPIVISFTTGA